MGGFKFHKFSLGSFAAAVIVIGAVIFWTCQSDVGKMSDHHVQTVHDRSRSPASIQKVFDYSYLEGDALKTAVNQRVVNSMNINKTESDDVEIQMGNFVLKDDHNEKDFACGYYDQVALTFEAEGVSVDGEKPTLVVESGCEIGGDVNTLTPIKLPVHQLKAQKPGNTDYKFFNAKSPVTVHSSNPAADWPDTWVLTDVKLTNSQVYSRVLHIRSGDILSKPMMNW